MCSAPAHPSRSLWGLLQFLDILHEVEDPKLVPAYQAKPCQSQIERDNNFHQTTSHSPLNVAQNVVHLIHIQSVLLVNIQLYILHNLQGPHSRLATQPLGSHVQIYTGLLCCKSRILHFLLRTLPWTIFRLLKMPLGWSSSLWHTMNRSTQFSSLSGFSSRIGHSYSCSFSF